MGKIAIASDHGGFELKQEIVKHLSENGFEMDDLGTDSPESVDYPDFAHLIAERIANGQNDRAILVCGTGIGMSITANRYTHVRASLCNDIYSSRMSRLHNDANVLVLGGRVIGSGLAVDIVSTWLGTEFEGGRHTRRLDKIEKEHLEDVIQKVLAKKLETSGTVTNEMIKSIVVETIEKLQINGNSKNNKE